MKHNTDPTTFLRTRLRDRPALVQVLGREAQRIGLNKDALTGTR